MGNWLTFLNRVSVLLMTEIAVEGFSYICASYRAHNFDSRNRVDDKYFSRNDVRGSARRKVQRCLELLLLPVYSISSDPHIISIKSNLKSKTKAYFLSSVFQSVCHNYLGGRESSVEEAKDRENYLSKKIKIKFKKIERKC